MLSSIYSIPKLCKSQKGWYVHFRYNKRQKRYKLGLNTIDDLKDREIEANILIKILSEKLKNGWNPFNENPIEDEGLLFIDALDFALNKKKDHLSKKTYLGYRGTVGFIKTAVSALSLDYLTIKTIKRSHIRSIMEKSKEQRNWSHKAYNKNLNYLKAVLSELIDWDIIEVNPAHKIKSLKVIESRANTPATDAQHEKIKNCLEREHPYFFNFIKTIYYTGARPKEILSIKLNMIDIMRREIILPAEITKVGKTDRTVIIDDGLLDVLIEMEIEKYPKDFYLFGSFRQRGKGNLGKHLDFICGTTPIKRDTATKRWKKIIKDGLGINVNMYSYKHKGGNDKLRAGVDLDSIRNQYGHSNKRMTKVYVKEITGYYKNDIINNSTEF